MQPRKSGIAHACFVGEINILLQVFIVPVVTETTLQPTRKINADFKSPDVRAAGADEGIARIETCGGKYFSVENFIDRVGPLRRQVRCAGDHRGKKENPQPKFISPHFHLLLSVSVEKTGLRLIILFILWFPAKLDTRH